MLTSDFPEIFGS